MAVTDYSTTPGSNTTISSINIAEGCPPSGINNAIRQLMADIATFLTSATFTSTTADATVGPSLILHRNSASPADNDLIGEIKFDGEDDGSTQTNFARIYAQIIDVTDTTEDGSLFLQNMIAGTVTTLVELNASGVNINDPADPTKQILIDASSITTGTVRTVTFPDSDGTVSYLGLAQTYSALKTYSAGISLTEGSAPTTAANNGAIYTKDSGTQPELFYREESSGDEVQMTSGGRVYGTIVNRWFGSYATYSSHTTALPFDNSIPQSSEGDLILTVTTGTLQASTNRLRATVNIPVLSSSANTNQLTGALFLDSGADAVAAGSQQVFSGGAPATLSFQYEYAPGATTAVAFKLRVGPTAGTMYINGDNTGRIFGGIAAVTMIVEEIIP